ncbi:hypothetical protein [Lacihabitans sp. CS3-21]|uniref:hypothetical protein n=1 Tax=Lacihabitans sp. CS3-21 TaxID=2487332 RepID=UPI0020CDB95C|nr:hypothetical protein [Lacihabitans sp. CS3-21]MCP9748192.1 hypothetical protein [Lacihabitans sp. CS3-21]
MKYSILLSVFLFFSFDAMASVDNPKTQTEDFDGRKRKKDGSYKKKNHTLKKLIQGKRYCDCPKH